MEFLSLVISLFLSEYLRLRSFERQNGYRLDNMADDLVLEAAHATLRRRSLRMKRHKFARHTVLPAQLFTILTNTKQYFVQIFGTKFHENRIINVRGADRCWFTPQADGLQLALYRFSLKS